MTKPVNLQTELIERTLNAIPNEGLVPSVIKGLQMARSNSPTQPTPVMYQPCLCFIVQGQKTADFSGKSYPYSPGQYLVTSVSLPVMGQITEASNEAPYLCLILDIEAAVIHDLMNLSGMSQTTKKHSKNAVYIGEVHPDLSDAFLRLLRCMDREQDRLVLAPMIKREILYQLLHSRCGEILGQLGLLDSQTSRISRVLHRLQTDYASKLSMDALAKSAGMSPSAFFQHFKEVTGISPLQYQKTLRLQKARELLIAGQSDATTAGLEVGYESVSQFNREYSRLFGAPPLRDLKRARMQVGG